MSSLKKHLLGIEDLSAAAISEVFSQAQAFKSVLARPIKKVPALRDKTIANVFFEASTRTRLSFELAAKRLSADVVNFTGSHSAIQKGESLLDSVQNILHMRVDMIVVRHGQPGVAHFLARHVHASVINAGDGTHEHPTQALLDAFSIMERLGDLKGRKVLILGDVLHSRVALSNILCLRKLGAKVTLCGPPTLMPPYIEGLGVDICYDLQEALKNCEVVNVLRLQLERQQQAYVPSLREYALHYGLTRARLSALGSPVPLIMHPGPMHRGVEIESELADDPSSIILQQVENGVAIRMAVLYMLGSAGKQHAAQKPDVSTP